MVDGKNATELGTEVTKHVLGPEGSFVEVVVERDGEVKQYLRCLGSAF